MPTLRQLKTFIAVAEYKKMSLAAEKLFISQPTVSQIIIDLEKEYNVKLFERFPRELKITPAGQMFLSSAQEIISINENLESSMKNIVSKRLLRIGATLSIGESIMCDTICRLKNEYPDIDSSVSIDNTHIIENRLIHNELDIALVEGIISKDEIYTEPIFEDYLVLICGPDHPFAEKEKINMEDLRNQNFILRERGSGTRAIFENIMAQNHIPYICKWECNSSTTILDAVYHNLGLGIISSRCIPNVKKGHEVIICNLQQITLKRYFYICYAKKHIMTSQMQDFISELKNIKL